MRVRINNIECRFSQGRYEIIKWYTNDYYGAEERMISEGWEKVTWDNGDWSMKRQNTQINSSCFKNPESCYTIATLEYSRGEDCCDMKTVGNRLLQLSKKNRKDFFAVYQLAEEMINHENRDKDEY
jgi:hypothetical protein